MMRPGVLRHIMYAATTSVIFGGLATLLVWLAWTTLSGPLPGALGLGYWWLLATASFAVAAMPHAISVGLRERRTRIRFTHALDEAEAELDARRHA